MGGSWIWCAGQAGNNRYADFVEAFAYDGQGPLMLNISVDSQYVAYLNGQPAAWGQYPDYPWRKVADTVDITAFARIGENRLCVQAYYDGAPSSVYYPGKAALRFTVSQGDTLLCESGEATLSRPSVDYCCGEMDKVTPQLSYSFACRADRRDGWLTGPTKGFSPSNAVAQDIPLFERPVEKLVLREAPAGVLTAQGVFVLRKADCASAAVRMQEAYLSARLFSSLTGMHIPLPYKLSGDQSLRFSCEEGDGMYLIVDLGAQQAGFLTLSIDAAEGTRVDIGYGEHLHDLRVRTSVGGRCYGAELTCGPKETRFTHQFKRIAGRYLQLFVYAKAFSLRTLSILPAEMPLEQKGSFRCSDHLHNHIYDTAVATLRLCMHEHYEDCPMREQALYAMDSRNQMLFTYYAFGEYGYARASLRLMASGQREDGLLPICAPSLAPITIPGFSLFWIIALYEYVLFSRDMAFGRDMLACARRILDVFLSRMNPQGLLSRLVEAPYWNFYEWQPGLDGGMIGRSDALDARIEAPLNALLAYALSRMASLCGMLGEPSGAYANAYGRIAPRFHDTFWDAGRGMYRTFAEGQAHFSAYVNALAIQAGLCPEEIRPALLEELAFPGPDVIKATLSSDIFRYEALLAEEKYHQPVFEEIAGVYARMLFDGATSFWETEKGAWDFDLAGSLCHGWSAVPIYLYQAYVLGVRPLDGGGYTVKPAQSGIDRARGEVVLPGCRVTVEMTQGAATVWEEKG